MNADEAGTTRDEVAPTAERRPLRGSSRRFRGGGWLALSVVTFAVGVGVGYRFGTQPSPAAAARTGLRARFSNVALPAQYGDLGPKLLEAGAIDIDKVKADLANGGVPMTTDQQTILRSGGRNPVVIDRADARFLLDFFWAVGLANRDSILTDGPMARAGDVGRFASTGGWRLGARPATELYAGAPLLPLEADQQSRLDEVAWAVYRPCCDNPVAFPDCNHGMAMLGMLTLMASEGATRAQMFEAAAAANAVWYPEQYGELALYYQLIEHKAVRRVDARRLVSADVASGTGFRRVHEVLSYAGLLDNATNGGSSAC